MSETLSAERCHAALHRATWNLIGRPFPVWAMAADSKPPKDVTQQSSSMPRNSALLYRNTNPQNEDSPAYAGFLRMIDGRTFWALIWPRTVKGKQVVELRLVEKPDNS
jgi:hypothetical protein